jgi:hypothetical protein
MRSFIVLSFIFFGSSAFCGQLPPWEEEGCGVIKEDLHLAPKALIEEFVRRDREGEFLRTSPWLSRAVLCPEHMGGPDTFKIASKWTIKELSPNRFHVRYSIEGQVESAQIDGKTYSVFHAKKEQLTEEYRIIQTPWGWKSESPWSDSKVTPHVAVQATQKSTAPFDAQSMRLIRDMQSLALARGYHTVLARELKQGANFDGNYRLAQIGCGAGCGLIAIIDCKTGKIYDPDLLVVDSLKVGFSQDRVEFAKDSPAITLRGCLNEDENRCGTFRYRWTGSELTPQN